MDNISSKYKDDNSIEDQYHPKTDISGVFDDPEKRRKKVNDADEVNGNNEEESVEHTQTDVVFMEDQSPMTEKVQVIDVIENEPEFP